MCVVWFEPGSNHRFEPSTGFFRNPQFWYLDLMKLPKPTYLMPKTLMTLGFRPKGYKKALNKPFTRMKNRVTHL